MTSSLPQNRKNMESDFAPRRLQSPLKLGSHRTMARNGNGMNSAVCQLIKNENYNNNIKRTFQYTRSFFTVLGFWPMISNISSRQTKYFSYIIILLCFSMIAFTFVPCASHMIFREKNAAVKLVLLGPVGAGFGAILKYAMILFRANTIKLCVNQMENDWMMVERADEHAIMTNHANTGRKIAVICTLFLYTGGMSLHAMVPILKGTKINEFNQTIRPLGYPGYDIFIDAQKTPTYEIIFFLICVSAYVRYTVTIGIISLAAAFVAHACGQIEIIILRLNKLFDGIDEYLDKDVLHQRISDIIRCHVNGLRFSTTIDKSLRDACLIEIMSSTLSICLLEYSCMWAFFNKDTVSIITYVMLLTSYIFNVFIFCHIGELLQNQYTRLFFTVSGIWPMITEYSSNRVKYLSSLIIILCFLMIGFTFVPCALHTIFRERNAAVRVVLLGPVGASFGAVLKYAIILLRSDTINKCVEQIKNDWTSVESAEELAIMTRHANTGRGIAVICTLFLYTGGMSFHAIVPILKGTKINEFNQTIRPLGYPGYDIFVDPQTTPTYEIIFFLICVSAHVRYTVTIGIISLAAVFVTHACGQVQIVMLRLDKLFDGIDHLSDRDELRQRISLIIKGHVNGLRLSATINDSLREVCLVEVMSSTLSICLLEYSCMRAFFNNDTVSLITFFLLLLSYIFNVFIFCHIGQLLQEQYETVGKAAYMIEWYRLPDKLGLSLVMVMAITGCPRKLTAGRMLDLSICNFGVIIRTSVTYLNMLRATTT